MQLHELKPRHKTKKQKRIGRGGKRGTYSGRGQKGQKSRAGSKLKPAIREIIKRYPKLRGYKFKPTGKKPAVVNVGRLNKIFKNDEIVDPQTLLKKGLIRKIKGRTPAVKILGKGKIDQPLVFKGCQFSKTAKEKITKAGGTIKNDK